MSSVLAHLFNPDTSVASPSSPSPERETQVLSLGLPSDSEQSELNLDELLTPYGRTPSYWAHSSVSSFHVRYTPPVPDLTVLESIEALVEGSEMSLLRSETSSTSTVASTQALVSRAWANREGRNARYEGKRVGGTIVVHFIKQNTWFLETALALLEGKDFTDAESQQRDEDLEEMYSGTIAIATPEQPFVTNEETLKHGLR